MTNQMRKDSENTNITTQMTRTDMVNSTIQTHKQQNSQPIYLKIETQQPQDQNMNLVKKSRS
jgi:hypothetical protein